MASFQKRGKTWQYTVSRRVNGKSKPIRKGGFRTKKEAQVAAEVENKLNKGIVPHLKLEPFDEYFEFLLNLYKPHIGKNTRNRYLTILGTIKEYFGSKPIQHIKRSEYQEFLNDYGKSKSKATVRKLNSHIRSCVQDALEDGVVTRDFTRKVKLSGLEPKKDSEKHLEFDESIELLNYVQKKIDEGLSYLVILLGLTSGMRFGEMVGLTRKDFDFINNTINIDKTWGYTNKIHEGFGPTKNESSIRIIKMDEETMKVFEDFFQKTPDNLHRLVFYSPSSKYKVISNGAVNKTLREALTNLDIDHISVHGLRHTHASAMIYKKEATLNYISERLGHADIMTIYNDYSHVMKELRAADGESTVKMFASMFAV
ncbi:site-specific integrase [Pseudogracilibacillus sp. SO30301A]|uniref:site-specific integrase n=1 Tax=Pseudogracilibacillus sp. SO30301A TaxID=3098291 RepID=UPI00300E0122